MFSEFVFLFNLDNLKTEKKSVVWMRILKLPSMKKGEYV